MSFRLAIAIVLSSGVATAAPPTPDQPPAAPDSERGVRGFEVMLRPGYGSSGSKSPVSYQPAGLVLHPDPGGVYDQSAAPYGGGLSGEVSLGYRFIPNLSAGIYGEMRSSSTSDPSDGTANLSRSGWGTGFYLRGYAPSLHEKLDPYVQIGVGYMKDEQKYERPVLTTIGSMPGDWTLTHHGVALPLAIGIDYRLLPQLAMGPSFRYAQVFGAGACLRESVDTSLGPVSSSQCSDADTNQKITKAESYGVWSAGIDLRLTL